MNIKNFVWLTIAFLFISFNSTACTAFGPSAVAKQAMSAQLQGDCKELSQFLTSEFITKSGGESAVISQCQDMYDKQSQSGNEMKSIKVIDTVIEDNGAMVILQIQWKEGQTSTMSVMLERENNQWKIWTIL